MFKIVQLLYQEIRVFLNFIHDNLVYWNNIKYVILDHGYVGIFVWLVRDGIELDMIVIIW